MFAINHVTFNLDKLLAKKKDMYKALQKNLNLKPSNVLKINWLNQNYMTITALILTGPDQEIMSTTLVEILPRKNIASLKYLT